MFLKMFKVSVSALIGSILLGVGGYCYAQEKLNLPFNSVAQSGPHDFVYSIHMDGSDGIGGKSSFENFGCFFVVDYKHIHSLLLTILLL